MKHQCENVYVAYAVESSKAVFLSMQNASVANTWKETEDVEKKASGDEGWGCDFTLKS